MRVLEGNRAVNFAAERLLSRASLSDPSVSKAAAKIVADVRRNGGQALRNYCEKFDGLGRERELRVSEAEMKAALKAVSPEFVKAIRKAAANIRRFAEWQKPKSWMRGMQPGLKVGQKVEPIASVGCYVPGGRYPLPSSLLMTVIPAQVASVPLIQVASPRPANETLAAAALLGVKAFYRMGGAQAIAAFAYGADSSRKRDEVLRVKKIVGPGNAYVTAAKKLVSFDCAIDILAGPTEAAVLAENGDARFYAADLVAQAEHDPDALVVFISSNRKLAGQVARTAKAMAGDNPIARESLERNAAALVVKDRQAAVDLANAIAPEHVTIPKDRLDSISSAGSVFVGEYSPQSLGDYASGPNHTLPTVGAAAYRGGLSVLDFVKIITVQEVTKAGLKKIAPVVTTLAEAEGLKAHAESVRVRLR
jgi:histidinol dehydrogenase